ncbi:MAG: hypothetical protein U9P10_07380 [Thermodesulfobacteriota bacterium]|nr:hypothetical protein [Thermodesulfobacteriota bacterium]
MFVTPVQIARNTGEPEIRVASPVYLGNTFHGVVVINADWRLAWELLSDNVYGRTGYPYIVNNKEQSSGIEQVNIAVSEMDKVVQQNAAVAEESASAAEEMSAQAEQLKSYVTDLVQMVTGKTTRRQHGVSLLPVPATITAKGGLI